MNVGRMLAWIAVVLGSLAWPAQAAEWPTKPVRVIVPYPAGGSLDAISRPFVESLAKRLGQPFVIDNRAGAAGAVGTEATARAAPDGYTLLAAPNGPLVLLPLLRKVPYGPTDLVPIGPMGEFVYGFAVLPKTGIKSMAELVAYAKKHPGRVSYSSPGAGSATNLRGEAFKILAGVDILHVPYRTGAEALIDFLSGTVDVIIDNVMFPHVRAGQATLLAVTSDRRFPMFPDVPTMAEAGYPVGLPTMAALYVPKGTPAAIQAILSRAIADANADPEVQKRVLQVGFFPMSKTGPELQAALNGQIAEYQNWVTRTGLKIE